MRTIIAGGRNFTDYEDLVETIRFTDNIWTISEVLSGGAKGADYLGEVWASANNVPVQRYPAEWDKYGKGAGFIRNSQMAENAEALIAFWDGESRGTKHMIEVARHTGLVVVVRNYKNNTIKVHVQ